MKHICSLLLVLLVSLAPFAVPTTNGAGAPPDLSSVLPFTDEFTVGVARLDLGRVEPGAWASAILDLVPERRQAMAAPVSQATQAVQSWLDEFRKAGGKVVYLVINLSDLGLEPPAALVIPLEDDSDPARLAAMMKKAEVLDSLSTAVLRGCLVAATDSVLERVKARAPQTPRRLERAFAAAPPGMFQAALFPYEDAGRVIEELMPVLPSTLGGGSSSTLAQGLLFASLGIQPPPEWSIEIAIRSKSAADAEALDRLIARAWNALGNIEEVKKHMDIWTELGAALEPAVDGDTVRIRLDKGRIGSLARTAAIPAIQESKTRADRVQILNNLKQIGLAMMMYASDFNDKLPDHLADTLPYLGSAAILLPLGSPVQPPSDLKSQPRYAQVAWIDQHGGYTFVQPGVLLRAIKDPSRTPLVYEIVDENPQLEREPFVGVCFADGHAESMARDAFDQLRERSKAPRP